MDVNKKYIHIVGVMSGTSLDGVDLVFVKFNKNTYQDFKILKAETYCYSETWQSTLQKAIDFISKDLQKLDEAYGQFLGGIIVDFIKKNNIAEVDFIASHGHTILHQPEKGITLQIGSGKEIAKKTRLKTVCDFRTQDVKLGGQGAPLVPIGDELLFSNYDYCLNLGGFSNVSFKKNGNRVAFDICPVNIVLNHYVGKLGLTYDDNGKIASKASINIRLLKKLNNLPYYALQPPKSLGLEWVKEFIFPLIDAEEKEVAVILRTFIEHIAIQIAAVIKSDSVLITGGGAFNSFLIARIQAVSNSQFSLPNNQLIDFKEALLFAFLGLLKVNNQINCLSSVTGASKNHSSGVIFNF